MISRVTNFSLKPNTLKVESTNQQQNVSVPVNSKIGYDCFEQNMVPAFKGKDDIKKYEDMLDYFTKSLHTVKNSVSKYKKEYLPDNNWIRGSLAVLSLGISEGLAYLAAKSKINDKSEELLERISNLQQELDNIIKSDINNLDSKNAWLIRKMSLEVNYAVDMHSIRNDISKKFISPVANKTEVPNCLMISCGTEDVNKELIEWTKANAPGCEVVTINNDGDIVNELKKAEERYQ